MATDPATIELLTERLGTRGATYSTRRMFGEYCLYRDGLPVALVCDDVLFVKDTLEGRVVAQEIGEPVFGPPYPGARLHLRIEPDAWDDDDWLRRLVDTTARALPPPKPRRPKAADSGRPNAATKRAPKDPACS